MLLLMKVLKNIKSNSHYFKQIPPLQFINEKLVKCYNLNSIDDSRYITKCDINYQALYDLIPELYLFYANYKIKQLFLNPNIKPDNGYNDISGFITLLKHFTNCYDYNIITYEKVINKKKVIYYAIMKKNYIEGITLSRVNKCIEFN